MDENTKKIIEEQLEKLPKDIRDAILSADLPEKFKTIANKHKLRIDQGGTLETETMLVMLGLEHPDDYTSNLKKEAGMSDEEAEKIAEEVSRTIFLPIRASLQKLHEEEREVFSASAAAETVVTKEERRIEHPSLEDRGANQKKDIFREKLEKQTRSAKEEVLLREPTDNSQNKQQTTAPQQTKPDPYREPIEKKDMKGIKQEGLKTNNSQLTTNNENATQIKDIETTTTPSQTQIEAKKPVDTPVEPTAEKLKAEAPPRIIPPPSAPPTSALPSSASMTPPIEKSTEQSALSSSVSSTKQKKEVPLQKTGIINMPNSKTENVVPRTDHPLTEKKGEMPQKPSVEINKIPAFAKEKISADQQSVSSHLEGVKDSVGVGDAHKGRTEDAITQKSENTGNISQDTLNILDKPKMPDMLTKEESAENTTTKYPQTTPASSPPPLNLPKKEIGAQTPATKKDVDLKKKDPVSDPYREPID